LKLDDLLKGSSLGVEGAEPSRMTQDSGLRASAGMLLDALKTISGLLLAPVESKATREVTA
jgi:hypothetical protein